MAIDLDFRTQFAVGHVITLNQKGVAPRYVWQNFFVDGSLNYKGINGVKFVPFRFSGVTVNRNGDNQTVSMVVDNNPLTRAFGSRMITETWLGTVDTLLLNPDNPNDHYTLTSYTGLQIGLTASGPTVELEFGSILDAVGSDIPRRRITEDVFGPLPSTANVRLQ